MMWPSAPESRIVGTERGRAKLQVASVRSGGCGGGLHLGGDLALIENPGNRLGWQSSACPQLSGRLGWVVEKTHLSSRPRWRGGGPACGGEMVAVLTESEMVDVDGAVGGREAGTAGVGERTSGGTGGGAFAGCSDEVVVQANGDIGTVAGARGGTGVSVPGGAGVEIGKDLRLQQYCCGEIWGCQRPGVA